MNEHAFMEGFQLIQLLQQNEKTITARALKESDRQLYILKFTAPDYPTQGDLDQLKREYALLKDVHISGIWKPIFLDRIGSSTVVGFEDFEGILLSEYLEKRILAVDEFLNLSVELLEILKDLHAEGIVHGNITPFNILINVEKSMVQLIHFHSAFKIDQPLALTRSDGYLNTNLLYIAPEQTGRTKDRPDMRSDLYSLGVTFYRILTGRHPFDSRDPVKLLYDHIASKPLPPSEINNGIPKIVSDIIQKLLSKFPIERYQSALSLLTDVNKCRLYLAKAGTMREFGLDQLENQGRFQSPQKPYGREKEIESIVEDYTKIIQGNARIIMISGPPGIGKSFLIEQFPRYADSHKGYFISGKFDQFKKNVPYSAIIDSFRKIIKRILIESIENYEAWKSSINKALGVNGRIITDIIPELESIIGKQPEVPLLGLLESQNRFNLTFRNFIRAFTGMDHPLVLFIDDCQWADSASLSLIKILLTDQDLRYFLFIGAHRDREFNANPQCIQTMNEIKQESRIPMRFLELHPLSLDAFDKFMSDAFQVSREQSLLLAELVFQKTQGNPFVAVQFLQSLYNRHILQFNHASSSWCLDWTAAQASLCHDNAADLIASRLSCLQTDDRDTLQMAASLGNIFDLRILSMVTHRPESTLIEHLHRAMENHFIEFYESGPQTGCLSPSPFSAHSRFKFRHDRIQQAAYHFFNEQNRKNRHLKIGRLLLKNIKGSESEEYLFDMVNHFNQSLDLITDANERLDLAQLYLRAGQKAKLSSAYPAAFDIFKIGLKFLSNDSWRLQYRLTLALFTDTVEAAHICGQFEEVEHLSPIVFQHAKKILDKIKIFEIIIQTYIFQQKLELAVQTGLSALELLGVQFPKNPGKLYLFFQFLKTRFYLMGQSHSRLLNLPLMTDPYKRAIMRIIATLGSVSYWVSPNLLPLLIFHNIILSIKYGNCSESAYSYAGYGMILCRQGRIDSGYLFGNLAQKLINNKELEIQNVKATFVQLTYIYTWKHHIKDTLCAYSSLYQNCLEVGENEFAAWSLMMYSHQLQWAGYPLHFVKDNMLSHLDKIKALKQETAYNLLSLFHQLVLNLLGCNQDPVCLQKSAFDEETMLSFHTRAKNFNFLANYYVDKMFLCYFFEKYDQAYETAKKAKSYLNTIKATVAYTTFCFYDSLIQLSFYENHMNPQNRKCLRQVKNNQNKIKQWTKHAPMNYLHRYYLVEAERKRILASDTEAVSCYERAIKSANENGYHYEAALANERAAQFYFSRNLPKVATAYIMDAYYLYDLWGAKAKTEYLEGKYRQIFLNINSFQKLFNARTTAFQKEEDMHMDSIGSRIDVHALLQAGQTMADEMRIDKLLSKLIRILMENAGAEKVFLILKHGDRYFLEAEGFAAEDGVKTLQGVPLDRIHSLPISVIHYVVRKREILVLDNAQSDELFADDPFIKEHKIKSVLCLPMIYQNELTAICYMENNLSGGVFTAERREALRLLASQAAISLKNALMLRDFQNELEERKKTQKELDRYKDQLTQLVEERTNELIRANKKLEREILEKSRMETHIKASLKEKELLLQEIHHRVKNNMQIISSLLNLQSRYTKDDKTLEMFKDSRDRIQSMALIHEILYKSDDLTRINLEKYTRNLVSGLYQSYGADPKKICLEIMIEKVFLSIDLAIPCGLIINELVSNALKYAFPPTIRESGRIRIALHPLDDGEVELTVEDDGVGFDIPRKSRQENSLGLRLVSILVEEQLHGSLTLRDHPGTVFTIRFPFQSARN